MKKMILGIGLIMFVLLSSACSQQDVQDQVENITDVGNEYVLSVKNGHPVSIPDITYGKAFENFFSYPTWRHFKAESGEDIVEFTGNCIYQDAEVKARLQFIIHDDEDYFEQGALSFNDVPQSNLITSVMIYKAFEEYANEHDIKIDNDENEDDMFSEGTQSAEWEPNEDDNVFDNPETENIDNQISDSHDSPTEQAMNGINEQVEQYICPQSDTKKLTVKQVKKLSKAKRRLAKNEIYARHGRKFLDQNLQEYFDNQDWYIGIIEPEEFDESVFNKIEKHNVRLLAKYE